MTNTRPPKATPKLVQVRIMIPSMTIIERRALEDALDEALAVWPEATLSITTNTPRER